MTKPTKKRRTVASIRKDLRERLALAQKVLESDESRVAMSRARVADIQEILNDTERKGGTDNAK